MRSVGLIFRVAYACSKQPDASAAGKNASSPTPQPSASAPGLADAGVANGPADAAVAEIADAAPPAPAGPPIPKVVLHTGDSMVGGYGGLTKALEAKFKPLGAKFVPDWMTSISIVSFDHDKHFAELLAKHSPDLVILTLGANDVFVPFPSSLVNSVKSVAGKASKGGRDCWWITPATWKPDTGITEVIKKNAIGCKVFDSAMLKISRGGDGIHPTNQGGVEWADKFWVQYQANPPAVAAITLDAGQ
jgi:hypothetical protein